MTARRGFSIVELLVVIALFVLSSAIVVAAYSNFNQNQLLKNGALTLRDDLRLAHNKASSGDKSQGCSGLTLVGWFVRINKAGTSYNIYSVCRSSTNVESSSLLKTVNLPARVSVFDILYNGTQNQVNILFQPVENTASFHNSSVPPFFVYTATSSSLQNQLAPTGQNLTIELSLGSTKYQVIVRPTGEVSEKKL